ncbi:sigma-54-dependent transcriptional regulator [Vibrio ulleungensis]|uniref:Sigma-54-dependent Fis family transcriptional regulator n=1 Tax=Vibrio ulleungensis TaxID=2807619 RepID=A0ABS2HJU8_9VIBR|nr:sigma-54 dependent transcriptional regulator [Vibrio ulleungensis]MBM7036362.1 sigma-54-dependent Fis family transcriptional regulator [Vibrio ulleungensis]
MTHIFLIDDEADLRDAISQSLELADLTVTQFDSAESALLALKQDPHVDVVVSDICMPGLSGLSLHRSLLKQSPDIPVILITGHGDIAMAVDAMREGVYDFIEKPFSNDFLIKSVKKAAEKRALLDENRRLKSALKHNQTLGPRIIGQSAGIEQVRLLIDKIADTPTEVLIFGETGCGKEMVARALHEQSSRRDNNFVAINCGALADNLIESELFGHEKGAFTGAEQQRIGKLEYANGGTLFLDEIESMPMAAQIKLLRALQEREIERLGSNQLMPIDIRVVAATKTDLKQLSQQGSFRDDLYYRLNVVHIDIPPLRERADDVLALFHHFQLIGAAQLARPAQALSAEQKAALVRHDWPGNVRELRNCAERFVLLGSIPMESENPESASASTSLPQQVSAFEKALIEQALAQSHGSITQTLELLDLPRKTLYDKMKKHQIDKRCFKNE